MLNKVAHKGHENMSYPDDADVFTYSLHSLLYEDKVSKNVFGRSSNRMARIALHNLHLCKCCVCTAYNMHLKMEQCGLNPAIFFFLPK